MPTIPTSPDRADFERLVRDALARCYDHAALETHPLAALLPRAAGEERSRAAQLRDTLEKAVESLRPGDGEPHPGAPEWRPYVLLRGRFLDGLTLQDLHAQLSLSERQLRREQGRALEAVAAELWDRFFPGQPALEFQTEPAETGAPDQVTFPVNPCLLDLAELLQGVAATLQRWAELEGLGLSLQLPPPGLQVLADRVILRQVLLAMVGHALGVCSDGPVTIAAEAIEDRAVVRVGCIASDADSLNSAETQRSLEKAAYWAQRVQAGFTWTNPGTCPGPVRLDLMLPLAGQALLLVVDDQEAAFRMFQRYLSHTGLRLIGVRDGRELAELAGRLQPQAITLDIMMPNMDGWEVLQSLRANPATRHIPVVVCSVWEEPELAISLGAADFLKKPVMQKDLLAALARLCLVETSAAQR